MKTYYLLILLSMWGFSGAADNGYSQEPVPSTVTSLTLEDALKRAEEQHPELRQAQHEMQMADADREQAGLWPNPSLNFGSEAITPNGSDSSPVDPEQRQDIVGLSQAFPLGGILGKAKRVAELNTERLQAEYAVRKRRILAEVKKQFYQVLYYQDVLQQQEELRKTLEDVIRISRERLNQGDIAEIEVIKGEANHARFLIEIDKAESNLTVAKTTLARALGEPTLRIESCAGTLESESIEKTPSGDFSGLDHPIKSVWEKRQAVAAAEIERARAESWPTFEVGVNYRRFEITDQDTFDVMAQLSIPIWNRNQGLIRNRQENLEREKAVIDSERNEIEELYRKTQEQIQAHQKRVKTFEMEILPKVEQAVTISQAAFAAGDVSILEVLDAYRVLAESKLTYLDEVYELQTAVIERQILLEP